MDDYLPDRSLCYVDRDNSLMKSSMTYGVLLGLRTDLMEYKVCLGGAASLYATLMISIVVTDPS